MARPSSSREMVNFKRLQALLRREKPDRVPVWPLGYTSFAVLNAGGTICDAYTNPRKSFEAQKWCCEQYDWVFGPVLVYGSWGVWEFGGEIRWPTREFDQAPIVVRCPVQTEEEAGKLAIPDIESGIVPIVRDFIEIGMAQNTEKGGPFYFLAPVGGPFTIAASVCGIERFCKWVIKKPELAHKVLEVTTDYTIKLCRYWKDKFGTERILPLTSEPIASNQLIAPKHFEKFVLPYLKKTHEDILEMGFKHIYCHICGEANANLPYWAQIPMGDPGIVSIGHEIDVMTAAKHLPGDIILGNLEPALLQTSTPEDLYNRSQSIIEKGKQIDSGFIFTQGCELPPKAPPLNVWMMTKAANDFGWY